MRYEVEPLGCDPRRLKALSEKLIVSYYENNYAGANTNGISVTTRSSPG